MDFCDFKKERNAKAKNTRKIRSTYYRSLIEMLMIDMPPPLVVVYICFKTLDRWGERSKIARSKTYM